MVNHTKDLEVLECFCGVQSIIRGAEYLMGKGLGIDILSPNAEPQPHRNIGTLRGFLLALRTLVRVKVGGLLWLAPPCSSWVWISRGTNKRSVHNPLGDEGQSSVRFNNRLVSRLVVLLKLARYLGVFWIIEQPSSSLLFEHPKLARAAKQLGTKTQDIWMRNFGSESRKRTRLWGDTPAIASLGGKLEDRTKQSVQVSVQCSGGVTGGKDLKATQAYPSLFGLSVCRAHFLGFIQPSITAGSDFLRDTVSGGDSSDGDSCASDDSFECISDVLEMAQRVWD